MISFSNLGRQGRAGNSLFQCASTICHALRNNDTYVFPSSWEYKDRFNLRNCFSDNIKFKTQYKEPFFHYQPIPYQSDQDLSGFFQTKKYFQEFEDVILGLLTPKQGFGIQYNTTAIHVRRGDYLTLSGCYEQLNMQYYNAAMNIIKSQKYMVFSDDITWCKQNFIGEQFIFSEEKDPIIDLSLMLSCENNIICNSSFGWWGAFLNKNPSKIVIAPKKWFGPKLAYNNTKDLIPSDWQLIG